MGTSSTSGPFSMAMLNNQRVSAYDNYSMILGLLMLKPGYKVTSMAMVSEPSVPSRQVCGLLLNPTFMNCILGDLWGYDDYDLRHVWTSSLIGYFPSKPKLPWFHGITSCFPWHPPWPCFSVPSRGSAQEWFGKTNKSFRKKEIPSGKRLHSYGKYGKSPSLLDKTTLTVAIFHSYVALPEGQT